MKTLFSHTITFFEKPLDSDKKTWYHKVTLTR